jgi:hypothetical protein
VSEAIEPEETTEEGRDWLWLEVLCLVIVLVAGAGARYWLGMALPFDDRELELLAAANRPEAGLRVPMIMFAGLALFFLYVALRRSAGVEAAFAGLLALQTSLLFQQQALRFHLLTCFAPVAMGLLMAWRLRSPAFRLPPALRRACLVMALAFAAKGTWLAAGLPERLVGIEAGTHADPQPLAESLAACSPTAITPLERLAGCELAWPAQRSLHQQVAGMKHAARLGKDAHRVTAADSWPDSDAPQAVLLDRAGACLLVVPVGAPAEVAREVLRHPR